MKYSVIVFLATIVFVFYSCGSASDKKDNKINNSELKGNISISGTFALYPLVQKWADEFSKIYPNVKVDVSAGDARKGMTDALSGLVNLGMISHKISKEEIEKGAWIIPVAKNAVLPIVNENNPVLQQLLNKGLDKETFTKIFFTGSISDWGTAVEKEKKTEKINVYTRSDECSAADVWGKFLDGNQEDFFGKAVLGDSGIFKAVKNDKLGIGYCNIGYAYDANSKYVVSGIKIIPIDFNKNGIIDDKEYFYQHKDSIVKAIADGRFLLPPASDLYFVCKGEPKDKWVITFLKWVLTDGQKFVSNAGYISLSKEKN